MNSAECINEQAGGRMMNLLTFVDEPQCGVGHAGGEREEENISEMSNVKRPNGKLMQTF